MLGDAFFSTKAYKEATVEYLKTVYLFRGYIQYASEAQFKAGVACQILKQKKEARNAYKRTIEFFPQSSWAQSARQKLESMEK